MTTSKFTPRYALVTGGGSGLGREFCLQLARDGWHVAIAGIHQAGIDETLQLVQKAGGIGRAELCDVTEIKAWQSLRERLRGDWPRLDLLVNNAGMFASGNVGQLDIAEVERVVRLNLFGAIYGCNTMVPWLIENSSSRPHIINVSSIYAFVCPPGMSAYNISKAGVVALSETLFGELRRHRIGVTVVCPGPMPTRFIENASFGNAAFRPLSERYVRESTLEPRNVVTASLRAAERGKLYVVLGTDQRWYWRLKRWLPTKFLKEVARRVNADLAATAAKH
jgi:NAD(P)-dependent dehydrogenase (short-subunit alcohol dehydrogenase family)